MPKSKESLKSMVGPAVQGPDFFDRETERASLTELLLDGAHVLVTAPRRTGKSSLLRQVALELSGRLDHLFIDVEGGHSAADIIVALTTAAHEKAAVWGRLKSFLARPFLLIDRLDEVKIDEVSIKLRDALQTNWRQQGDQFLRDLAADGELVIIIDELPILLNRLLTEGAAEEGEVTRDGIRRVDGVMTWLRAACQAHQGRLRFVFCGSIGLGPVLRRAGLSATINHLTPLHLDPWSPEVAAAFLEQVARTYGLTWGAGGVDRVVERLGCAVPHHVQLYFAHLKDDARRRDTKRIETADVDRVFERAMLASHSHAHLTHYEERLTDVLTPRRVPLALDLLTEAAVTGRLTSVAALEIGREHLGVEPREAQRVVADLLDMLEHDGYLVRHGSDFEWLSAYVATWWRRRHGQGYIPRGGAGEMP